VKSHFDFWWLTGLGAGRLEQFLIPGKAAKVLSLQQDGIEHTR
jgi:hypothetical protein